MLLGLYRYVSGYLDIQVSGERPERLVNLAVEAGMDLWNLHWRGARVYGRLLLRDFFAVRPLCRQAGCRVRVRGRHGLPFLRQRVLRRRALLAGALGCLVVLLWLSSHVWLVEVRGTAFVDARAVRQALSGLGLRPGAWKGRLHLAEVERRLPGVLPQITWAAARLQGTRAVVDVVERYSLRALPPVRRVDVVAGRACTVQRLVVFSGHPRVREGEAVTPGQVLIEGGVYIRSAPAPVLPGFPRPEPDLLLRPTVAEGQVIAQCTAVREFSVPLYREERVLTGHQRQRLHLRLGTRTWLVGGEPPFAAAETQRRGLAVAGWRNRFGPVELQLVTMREQRVIRHPIPLEAALQEVQNRLLAQLAWRLAPGDRVLRAVPEVVRRDADTALVRTVVETLEDIGRPVSVHVEPPE